MPRADRGEALPLSFGQERLWFLDQLSPGNPFYNDTTIVRVRGLLDVDVLRRSIARIVERHEVLRTVYSVRRGEPVASIMTPPPALDLPCLDLSGVLEVDREAEVQRRAGDEVARAFRLDREAPIRLALLRFDAAEHVLLITMHHIVSDAWSLDVFFRELTALYRAFSAGLEDPLPALRVQYAEFARWQRAEAERVAADQLPYWRTKLSMGNGAATLRSDLPRPSVRRFRGASHAVALSRSLTDALKTLSRRERVTTFSTLLSAFYVLLHARSGHERLFVGSGVAGRGHLETEALIGFFVNTLVFSVDLTGNPTFRELLARVSADVIESLAHQDVPFERVVAATNPERGLDRNPLFQVWFNLVNTPTPRLDVPGLDAEVADAPTGTARIELALIVWESDGRIRGRFEYDQDVFLAGTIAEMAEQFVATVNAAVSQPDAHLQDLGLRPRGAGAHPTPSSSVVSPRARTVLGLFRESVRRRPHEAAVICGDRALSYEELDQRSDGYAAELRVRGVGPDVLVAIGLERSVDLLVGMLSVLKAGGAYVPLDPSYPRDYLASVVEDAQPSVVMTRRRLIDRLGVDEASALCLDERSSPSLDARPLDEVDEPWPERLAYVIYTSGSTGRPKGVEITHRNLLYSTGVRAQVYAEPVVRYLLLSSCSFDSSVAGLYWTLMRGGTLIVPEEKDARDLSALGELVNTHGVTHTLMVPSLYRALLEQAPDGMLRSLQRVILAGESCAPQITQEHHRRLPGVALVNEYGPTEATVWATMSHIDVPVVEGPVSIGRPIPGTRIHLLDPRGEAVPSGAAGEIYIGGPGVARGYLGQRTLTAACFVPDPVSAEPGRRLFRTGDVARLSPDGTLHFLGRADQQVKIRGHRIELETVKRHLVSHPNVQDAAVADRDDGADGRRLVGYLVIHPGTVLTSDRVRAFLEDRLPDYMIPSVFVILDELPLLPNGKVDMHALPDPDRARPALDTQYAGASTGLERHLVDEWQRLLAIAPVGIHDNFFAIGGNSLKAAILAHRLTQSVGHTINVTTIFQYSSVTAMAAHLVERYPALAGFTNAPEGEMASSPAVPGIPRQIEFSDVAHSRVDELSDDEVRVRLAQLLSGRTSDE